MLIVCQVRENENEDTRAMEMIKMQSLYTNNIFKVLSTTVIKVINYYNNSNFNFNNSEVLIVVPVVVLSNAPHLNKLCDSFLAGTPSN